MSVLDPDVVKQLTDLVTENSPEVRGLREQNTNLNIAVAELEKRHISDQERILELERKEQETAIDSDLLQLLTAQLKEHERAIAQLKEDAVWNETENEGVVNQLKEELRQAEAAKGLSEASIESLQKELAQFRAASEAHVASLQKEMNRMEQAGVSTVMEADKRLTSMRSEKEKFEAEVDSLRRKLTTAEEKAEDYKKSTTRLRETNRRIITEKNAAESAASSLTSDVSRIREERDDAFERIENLRKLCKKLESEKSTAAGNSHSLTQALNHQRSAREQLEIRVTELEATLRISEKENVEIEKKYIASYNLSTVYKEKAAAAKVRAAQKEQELAETNEKLATIKEELRSQFEETAAAKDHAAQKERELAETNERLTTIEEELRAQREEKDATDAKLRQLEAEFAALELQNGKLATTNGELQKDLQTSRQKNGQLATTNADLQRDLQNVRQELQTAIDNSGKLVEEMTAAMNAKVAEAKESVIELQPKYTTALARVNELEEKLAEAEKEKQEAEKREAVAVRLRSEMSIGFHGHFIENNEDLDEWKTSTDKANQRLYDRRYLKYCPPMIFPRAIEVREEQQDAPADASEAGTSSSKPLAIEAPQPVDVAHEQANQQGSMLLPIETPQPVDVTPIREQVNRQSPPPQQARTPQPPDFKEQLEKMMRMQEEILAKLNAQSQSSCQPIKHEEEPPSKRLRLDDAVDEVVDASVSPFLPDDAEILNALPTSSRCLESTSVSSFGEEVNMSADHRIPEESAGAGESFVGDQTTPAHPLHHVEIQEDSSQEGESIDRGEETSGHSVQPAEVEMIEEPRIVEEPAEEGGSIDEEEGTSVDPIQPPEASMDENPEETSGEGENIDAREATPVLERIEDRRIPEETAGEGEGTSGAGKEDVSMQDGTESSCDRRETTPVRTPQPVEAHNPDDPVASVLEEVNRLVATGSPSIEALEEHIISCFAVFKQTLTSEQLTSISRAEFEGRVFWLTNAARKKTAPEVLTEYKRMTVKLFELLEEQRSINSPLLTQPSSSSTHDSQSVASSEVYSSEIGSEQTSSGSGISVADGNLEEEEEQREEIEDGQERELSEKRDEEPTASSSKNSGTTGRMVRRLRVLKKSGPASVSAQKRKSAAPIPRDDPDDPLLTKSRPRRLKLYRNMNVFGKFPRLKVNTNIMLADYAAVIRRSLDEVVEYNDALWNSLEQVKERLSKRQLRECNAMVTSEADPDAAKLLYLIAYFNGRKQKKAKQLGLDRLNRLLTKMDVATPEAAILHLEKLDMFQPLAFTCNTDPSSFYLYIDRNAVPVEGGLRMAILSVVAATKIFDATFDEGVEDVVSFLYDSTEKNDPCPVEKLLARE